ncbi:MAG: IS21-like element helper ATPase IstB [Firmicutes bacterium]|nr:IS21-like element helper ATPase IstB [Bacillota bacterium]
MLTHQTAEKLRAMRLPAMAAELVRQTESPAMDTLDFGERIGMLVDAEWTSRENNRIKKLTAAAKLRDPDACLANLDYRPSRKLDRAYLARLSDLAWIRDAKNIIFTGCTGTGKTYLANAFGVEACRKGLHVAYYRVNRLTGELAATADAGGLHKLLARLKKTELLILDDWGLTSLNPLEGRLLLEVFEDRYNERSTIIAAQLPVSAWHGLFEDSTVADAILDRVVHNSYRFELQGPSMRSSASTVDECAPRDQSEVIAATE